MSNYTSEYKKIEAKDGFNQYLLKYLSDKAFQALHIDKGTAYILYSVNGEHIAEIHELDFGNLNYDEWNEDGFLPILFVQSKFKYSKDARIWLAAMISTSF